MPEKSFLTIVELPPHLEQDRHGATYVAASTWLERAAAEQYEPVLADDGVCHLSMNKVEQGGKHYVRVLGRVISHA